MMKAIKGKTYEGSRKGEKYYPHLDFDKDQFPDIEKMQVGKKYILKMEVKPTSKRDRTKEEEGKTEKETSMCFDILKVGLYGEGGKEKSEKKEETEEEMIDKMIDEDYNKSDKK